MVNKQNCHYWATENPRDLLKRPLHSPTKVIARLYNCKRVIIGPNFLEDYDGKAATLTSEHCIAMINNFFVPELQQKCLPT